MTATPIDAGQGIRIQTSGIHHVALRASDLERSRVFYVDRLGFPTILQTPGLLIFAVGSTLVAVRSSDDYIVPGDASDPFRVGLDHLALSCTDEAELRRVASALDGAGVENTGVKRDRTLGKNHVGFTDPDGISWALYMTQGA